MLHIDWSKRTYSPLPLKTNTTLKSNKIVLCTSQAQALLSCMRFIPALGKPNHQLNLIYRFSRKVCPDQTLTK